VEVVLGGEVGLPNTKPFSGIGFVGIRNEEKSQYLEKSPDNFFNSSNVRDLREKMTHG